MPKKLLAILEGGPAHATFEGVVVDREKCAVRAGKR